MSKMFNLPYTIRITITNEIGAAVFEDYLTQYNEGELSEVSVKPIHNDNEGERFGAIVELTFTQKPQPPSRSPLHPKAITKDDLKQGLAICLCNENGNSSYAIVIGEPFKRGDKYGQDDPQAYAWMLPVVTTNYGNKLVQQDWSLADMGVVPYEHQDGSFLGWSDQNYTLATS